MVNLKNFSRSNWLLFIIWGFIFSWFEKERVTPFLFLGRSFEGRSDLVQVILIGIYTLLFAVISFLLLALLEKFSASWDLKDGQPASYYDRILVWAVIILLLIYPFKYITHYLSFPYPLEYREAAVVYPAITFGKGINPYSLQNFPDHIYLYGILYPLTLAPFINLSSHPLLIARAYNLLFLIAFLITCFWIFRKRQASLISSVIGVLILLNSMCNIWRINGARPDAPALFFAFFGFYFLLKRDFDNLSIFMCALSCVISFYFKQYMLFSVLVVVVFLFLFVSKQKAYLFIATVLGVGLSSFVVIRHFFPLYYEYSILHHFVASDPYLSTSRMVYQTSAFINYYWIVLSLYLFYLYKKALNFELRQLKEIRITPFKLKDPFIRSASIDIFDVGIIIAAIILTFWLGKHAGTVYTYYGELLLPFLLYSIIPKIDEIPKLNLHRTLIQLLVLALCIFPFRLNYEQNFAAWKEAFSTLTQYAATCKNIYDKTPLIALYKIEHNMSPIYNNGQIEYAQTTIPDRKTIFGRVSTIPAGYMEQRFSKWKDDIQNSIEQQTFDCIFSEDAREIENYKNVSQIPNILGRPVYVRVPLKP